MNFLNKKTSWADCAVHTTLCKQLAYYLIMYSPIEMAADLPENYEGNKALKFICDVPTDWSDTKVLNAKAGDYYTVDRCEKGTNNWYLGSITDENPRSLEINLNFLKAGMNYKATIYSDGKDANWDTNPEVYNISTKIVNSTMKMNLKLAPGGGQAIQFIEQ